MALVYTLPERASQRPTSFERATPKYAKYYRAWRSFASVPPSIPKTRSLFQDKGIYHLASGVSSTIMGIIVLGQAARLGILRPLVVAEACYAHFARPQPVVCTPLLLRRSSGLWWRRLSDKRSVAFHYGLRKSGNPAAISALRKLDSYAGFRDVYVRETSVCSKYVDCHSHWRDRNWSIRSSVACTFIAWWTIEPRRWGIWVPEKFSWLSLRDNWFNRHVLSPSLGAMSLPPGHNSTGHYRRIRTSKSQNDTSHPLLDREE